MKYPYLLASFVLIFTGCTDSSLPAQSGLPACESNEASTTLIDAFDKAQFARQEELSAIEVTGAKATIGSSDVKRICTAKVSLNNSDVVSVNFTIEPRQDSGFMLEFEVNQSDQETSDISSQSSSNEDVKEAEPKTTTNSNELEANNQPSDAPKFQDYQVAEIYLGSPAKIEDPAFHDNEAALGALKQHPTFAGEYVPFNIEVGCGTGGGDCAPDTGFVNVKTGQILQLDTSDNGWAEFGWKADSNIVKYKADSRLLVTEETNLDANGNSIPAFTNFYVVDDGKLQLIKKVQTHAH